MCTVQGLKLKMSTCRKKLRRVWVGFGVNLFIQKFKIGE